MTRTFTDDELNEAYGYLMSRLLVARQEIVDLAEDGVDYNVVKYNPVGSADFVNPNLDVAYLEAWVAVDPQTPALLTVPDIEGRYSTAQLIDGWGEVIANINERTLPDRRSGTFALVAPGASASAPEGTIPIELHSDKAKLLARVELKDDWDDAVALARQFTLRSTGDPQIEPPPPVPLFANDTLIDSTAFDLARALIESAPDRSPAAATPAAKALEIADYVASSARARAEVDEQIRTTVVPWFLRYAVTESGVFRNGWLGTLVVGNYDDELLVRSAANLVGIWANSASEVVYYVGTRDGEGQPLDGSRSYRVHFQPDALPSDVVDGYWSIILVSLPDYRVIPNPDDRFNLNAYSPLVVGDDGSIDLLLSPTPPDGAMYENWLPTPVGRPFSLTLRAYVPRDVVLRGDWFPAPILPSSGTEPPDG